MSIDADAIRQGRFVPRRRHALAEAELDGELVIYDHTGDAMHILNPSAALVWQCIDGEVTLDELVRDFAEATGQDEDTMRSDLTATLLSFAEQGLLAGTEEPAEAAAAPEADGGESDDIEVIGPAPET